MPSGDTWYRVTFTLPPNFVNPSLQGQIHVDNNAQIYLNPPTTALPSPNNQIGAVPGGTASNFRNPPESFGTTNPALFVSGQNTLYFRVSNVGGPTGLDYQATVAYCEVIDLPVELTCVQGIVTIRGTSNGETITGTAGQDYIAGLGGNDIIDGLGGNDIICGDDGDDILRGGAGNDRIIGGSGNDGMDGGSGNDGMWGEADNDRMFGGSGNDGLNGGAGDDTPLNGGAGDDVVDGRDTMGTDSLNGGPHINGDFCISGPGDTKVPGTCEFA